MDVKTALEKKCGTCVYWEPPKQGDDENAEGRCMWPFFLGQVKTHADRGKSCKVWREPDGNYEKTVTTVEVVQPDTMLAHDIMLARAMGLMNCE